MAPRPAGPSRRPSREGPLSPLDASSPVPRGDPLGSTSSPKHPPRLERQARPRVVPRALARDVTVGRPTLPGSELERGLRSRAPRDRRLPGTEGPSPGHRGTVSRAPSDRPAGSEGPSPEKPRPEKTIDRAASSPRASRSAGAHRGARGAAGLAALQVHGVAAAFLSCATRVAPRRRDAFRPSRTSAGPAAARRARAATRGVADTSRRCASGGSTRGSERGGATAPSDRSGPALAPRGAAAGLRRDAASPRAVAASPRVSPDPRRSVPGERFESSTRAAQSENASAHATVSRRRWVRVGSADRRRPRGRRGAAPSRPRGALLAQSHALSARLRVTANGSGAFQASISRDSGALADCNIVPNQARPLFHTRCTPLAATGVKETYRTRAASARRWKCSVASAARAAQAGSARASSRIGTLKSR